MRIALKSALMLTTRVIQIINPELHRHMQRTALIALTLAQRLELPDERQQTIFCAALLHDIGVLGDYWPHQPALSGYSRSEGCLPADCQNRRHLQQLYRHP